MRKFLIFFNPKSGAGRAKRLASWAHESIVNAGYSAQLAETDPMGLYTEAAAQIIDWGITEVVVVGGDGTVSSVVGALRGMSVRFGIIPAGSGNGLAFGAGISRKKHKALAVILAGKSREVDGFEVNGTFGCMVFGSGLDGEVAFRFSQGKKRGFRSYLRLVFSSFLRAKRYSFQVQSAEFSERISAYFVSVANSNQYGNHFQVAPAASLGDGKLDVVVASSPDKWLLLGDMFRHLIRSQAERAPNKRRDIIYFQTSALELSNNELAPCHLDGEVAGTPQKISLRVIRSAFTMFVP